MHVSGESLHVLHGDLFLGRLSHDASMHHLALDMLTGNADNHLGNVHLSHVGTFFHSLADGMHRFFNIGDNATFYTVRNRLAHTEHFQFPKFILAPDYCADFGRPNVQTYNQFVVFHIQALFTNNLIFILHADPLVGVPTFSR